MNTVLEIKRRQAAREEADLTALLRAIAPAARRNQAVRRKRERGDQIKDRINTRLAHVGIPLRVV